jgi:signal transduction histidine kinase/ActR/RegA family two-component response regulator
MPQAAWAHYLPPLRRAYETAEAQQFDAEALFPDGTARFRHAAYVPIKGPTGKVTKVLAVGHDVTAERRLSEELRQQSEVLKEADRRKTEFLAVLSHELRNPLAPIRNCLFLLDRSLPGNHSARRVLAVLQRQTEHLTRLVDDLLDVTRISRGKIELQRARLDARDVARRTCDDVRIVFAQRGVGITYTQTPEPMWVDADGIRLAQMVGNLLNNALKFTQPGGQVDVIVGQHGGRCEIRVRDTGLGIEAAELDRIFDPFMQTERTQKRVQGGLGIGLTLVRELALLHEGKVHALSAGPDQGAEFVLALPLVVAPADAADPAAAGPQVATLSILIVDDNEDAGATLADLLALAGHSVRVVTTGQAGIDAASVHPPDALICDIGLPDRSGYEVIRTLRATPSASRVFAISLTGYAQPRDRQRAVEAGFDAHLAKPPSFDELNELLSTAAQKRGPTRPAPR